MIPVTSNDSLNLFVAKASIFSGHPLTGTFGPKDYIPQMLAFSKSM